MSDTTIGIPSAANRSAIARPSPLAAPVTTATRPGRSSTRAVQDPVDELDVEPVDPARIGSEHALDRAFCQQDVDVLIHEPLPPGPCRTVERVARGVTARWGSSRPSPAARE